MSKDPTRIEIWLFRVGVVLVVISSIVIGIFNIGVLFLFGIPILTLILGIFFIWFSTVALRFKAFATLLPIPLVIISGFVAYQLNKAEPETFLIPLDFRGKIIVFYDEPCGQSPVYRDKRRVYEISSDGVLITQFKKNRGYLDQKFYFVDSEKNVIEIPYFYRQHFETERKEWGYSHSSPAENFTKETVGAFWAYGGETNFLSQNSFSFLISNYHYFEKDEKDRWLEGKRFTEIATKLLKDCRQIQ